MDDDFIKVIWQAYYLTQPSFIRLKQSEHAAYKVIRGNAILIQRLSSYLNIRYDLPQQRAEELIYQYKSLNGLYQAVMAESVRLELS